MKRIGKSLLQMAAIFACVGLLFIGWEVWDGLSQADRDSMFRGAEDSSAGQWAKGVSQDVEDKLREQHQKAADATKKAISQAADEVSGQVKEAAADGVDSASDSLADTLKQQLSNNPVIGGTAVGLQ